MKENKNRNSKKTCLRWKTLKALPFQRKLVLWHGKPSRLCFFCLFHYLNAFFSPKLHSPPLSTLQESLVFYPKTKILGPYVFVGAIVGLFLPLAYIFEGIFEGDKEGIKAAAPAAQVLMEGRAFSDRFSIPIPNTCFCAWVL